MTLALLWMVVGLVLLVVGGEALVRGASGLAQLLRVRPAVVGLTVVAAGTSMPELMVSMTSALNGQVDVAVGNIVGSNIFNICAILGLTAMLAPMAVRSGVLRLEWPATLAATWLFVLLVRDGTLDRFEGGSLLAALVFFTGYAVWLARREVPPEGEVPLPSFGGTGGAAWARNVGGVVAGVGALALGADRFVEGAVEIATALGVSELVIGLTVVAAGTSLPELVTSIVAARRGNHDVAIGNVLGSNLFNLLGIGGATAFVTDLPVTRAILDRDGWWMLAATALLFPLLRTEFRLSRLEGAMLFAVFVAWTLQLVLP